MIAMLLAATLQFGTVKQPVLMIDVDHPKLEEVSASATAGMTKTHIANADIYLRVPEHTNREDATIDVVIAMGGRFRMAHVPFFADVAPEPPRISLAADDATLPIVRVDVNSPPDVREVKQTILLDLRGEPAVAAISSDAPRGHHGCNSQDEWFAAQSEMTCEWNAARKDFVCRQARMQHRDWSTRMAWRAFLLLRDEPIVRARDVKKPEELLTIKERTVGGEGVVEPIAIADGLELFVIPSTRSTFELHGWLVDHQTQRVVAVSTTPLDSDAEPEPRVDPNEHDHPYTPDRQAVDVHPLAATHDGSLLVAPFTAKDGDATGLFWLGYDGRHASLLRVATDAYEYLGCGMAVRPASAISQTIVASPFSATLRVAGAAPQWSDLIDPVIDDVPCSYNARVTWKNEFVIEQSGEKKCAGAARRTLAVHANGTVTATALQPSP